MLQIRFTSIALALSLVVFAGACGSDSEDGDGSVSSTVVTSTTAQTDPTTTTVTESTTVTQSTDVVTVALSFPRLTETGYDFVLVERQVTATPEVELAALELLLSGPTAEEEATLEVVNPFGYTAEILVLSLTIADGTATADFSADMLDYGGGSANVEAIGGSITNTLLEFPAIEEVIILVEGEPEQLQP